MKVCLTAAMLALLSVSFAVLASSRAVISQTSCLVSTGNGDIQGVNLGSTCAFRGVPFAAPPVGALRWRPPQPAAPWAPATFSATVNPPSCPAIFPPATTRTEGIEDCLKLNIWTPNPAPSAPVPVIVWIHTGAFQGGNANQPPHNGRHLAEQTGLVVVVANYRVGPFGFMGHPALTAEDPTYPSSGNYGFLDQRAALAWVRDHIAAFGGDANNVTIDGQSAGGHSVSLHVVSPGSAGYFGRAIMQSGTRRRAGRRCRMPKGLASASPEPLDAAILPKFLTACDRRLAMRCCWHSQTDRRNLRQALASSGDRWLTVGTSPINRDFSTRADISIAFRSCLAPRAMKDGSTSIAAFRRV